LLPWGESEGAIPATSGRQEIIQLRLRRSGLFAKPESVAVEHEPFEEGREFGVRVEREHVRNVLVRTDDDHCAPLAVDTAQVEDVETALEVRRVGLLVVDQAEPPLARQQKRRKVFGL
jgi:hypothetical protein